MKAVNILSTKLTSKNIQNANHAGFIDKLFLDAKSLNLNKLDFINNFKSISFDKYEDGNFKRSRELRLAVTTPADNTIYLKYRYSTNQVYQIVLNPSCYSSYQIMISDIDFILAEEFIETLPITRIDKTIDIAIGAHEIHRGLEIKHKRSIKVYDIKSGRTDNIQVGKKPEIHKIYDKQALAKYDFPCTRLEAFCTGNKVEFPNLKEMKRTWQESLIYQDQTFKYVQLNDVHFKKLTKESAKKKASELELFIRYMPYCLARSYLNRKGNFDRDYKKLINLVPWGTQPTEILNTGLRKFFNYSDSGDKNG